MLPNRKYSHVLSPLQGAAMLARRLFESALKLVDSLHSKRRSQFVTTGANSYVAARCSSLPYDLPGGAWCWLPLDRVVHLASLPSADALAFYSSTIPFRSGEDPPQPLCAVQSDSTDEETRTKLFDSGLRPAKVSTSPSPFFSGLSAIDSNYSMPPPSSSYVEAAVELVSSAFAVKDTETTNDESKHALTPELMGRLVQRAKSRAIARASMSMSLKDLRDAVSEELDSSPQRSSPADEIPVHFDAMLSEIRNLSTAHAHHTANSGGAGAPCRRPRVLVWGERSATVARMFLLAGADVALPPRRRG